MCTYSVYRCVCAAVFTLCGAYYGHYYYARTLPLLLYSNTTILILKTHSKRTPPLHTVQPVRQLLGRYPFLPPALRRLQEPRRHGEQYGGSAGYGQDPGRPKGRQVRARVALRLRGDRTGLEQLRRHHRGVIALLTPLPQT